MSNNNVIGVAGKLPWHLPADLQHFKKVTSGKVVVMGRKTHQSIGAALPNRRNIILSSDRNFSAPNCEVYGSIETMLENVDTPELIIIGGSNIYCQFLNITDKIYLTIVETTIAGDSYFPQIDLEQWQQTELRRQHKDKKNKFSCKFITLIKSTT